ncbi:MAG: hypothetical protein A2128_02635 [Candidatus Liptonbacteria bacterium GWC1_60_9]|uniref:Uncharacterized protein n=1 Tax=Candidatus Liptonbacteria bacterium GWC1_60_9 TaxID=1798645 RepID=A0A1G2C4V6_9BACT|nr:MAG: hypothetical protein A2128_02635 [Candidatus Liptonbacteria bacterium GWC1_60_9]
MIFFGLWSLFADIGEIVGALAWVIPIAGQGLWLLMAAFGMMTSAVIATWLWFRGGSFGAAKKLVVFLIGSVFDSLTTGILPLRTISLFVAIWIHNHPKLTALTVHAAKVGMVK